MHASSEAYDTQIPVVTQPHCAPCGHEIRDSYFVMDDDFICHPCRTKLDQQHQEGSRTGRMLLAVAFGSAAAVTGAVIYFAILSLTGYEIGLVAIGVGWIVGRAVHLGSRGRGGWGYQGLAIGLTYSAIVVTYIPFILTAAEDQWSVDTVHGDESGKFSYVVDGSGGGSPAARPEASDAIASDAADNPDRVSVGEIVLGLGFLFVFAVATPVLAGVGNIIGLLIIGFALHQAWAANRPVQRSIDGPFRIAGRSAA